MANILKLPLESWRWTLQSTWVHRTAPGCFKPPHTSHIGCAWERMISIDCLHYSMHEVLVTLMASWQQSWTQDLLSQYHRIQNHLPSSPQQCSWPSKQALHNLLQVTLKEWISLKSSGSKFKTWQTPFGGDVDTSRPCSFVKSGSPKRSNQTKDRDIVLLKDNKSRRNEWPMITQDSSRQGWISSESWGGGPQGRN